MSSTNAISVIIPVHNQVYPLSITLWGFSRQAPQFRDCEIIIVDDGSTEPIEAVVDSYRDRLNITYVRIPHRGRAAARNEGLCQLDSEVSIAVFCDADRVPRPDFLGAHYRAHSDGQNQIVIGQVRELYLSQPERKRDILLQQLTHEQRDRIPQYCQLVYGLFDLEGRTRSAIPWVATLSGNMSIHKDVLARSGGFDEEFNAWGFEHMELGYRAYRTGAEFRYAQEAVNVHLAHPRDTKGYEQYMKRSHALFVRKHPQPEIAGFLSYMTGELSLRGLEAMARALPEEDERLVAPDQYVRITNF